MYYPDLTYYRNKAVSDDEFDLKPYGDNSYEIYPCLINIGWLDSTNWFPTGNVPFTLLHKLEELLFRSKKF